jgi:hypothetical protein
MDEPVLTAGIDPRRLLAGEMGSGAVPTSTVSLSDVPTPMERIWWQALQLRNQKTHVLLASLLAQSTPCVSANLKGVITVPNDSKYGPWAGMIVTGDDDQIITTTGYVNGTNPKIYSVRPDTGDCDQNTSSLNSQSCVATITVRDATGATQARHIQKILILPGHFSVSPTSIPSASAARLFEAPVRFPGAGRLA